MNSAATKPAVFECVNLHVGHRKGQVFGPFNLSVGHEFLVLRNGGESKRLLIETFGGLRTAVDGQIRYAKTDRLSVSLQEGELPSYWSVQEYLEFCAESGACQEWIGKENQSLIKNLHNGEKRVLKVLATLSRPARLFIMEDPFAGLEESICLELISRIRGHVSKGATVIITASFYPFERNNLERMVDLT